MVDGDDVIEGADVDNGIAVEICVPCAVCAAVIDTESCFCGVKVLDARAHCFYGVFVTLHFLRGLTQNEGRQYLFLATANAAALTMCGCEVRLLKPQSLITIYICMHTMLHTVAESASTQESVSSLEDRGRSAAQQ